MTHYKDGRQIPRLEADILESPTCFFEHPQCKLRHPPPLSYHRPQSKWMVSFLKMSDPGILLLFWDSDLLRIHWTPSFASKHHHDYTNTLARMAQQRESGGLPGEQRANMQTWLGSQASRKGQSQTQVPGTKRESCKS